ncbi:hypothetical protein PI124_g19797 [Phytophthora idaei]|nr:hypothetical protein PI125_g15079 [Phytophthora idaei]KAG3133256.1 hypothetical protein PI126_g19260 [Phytophthora idaei]KAG3235162.1 hypothetical protein PI124_g19797 [Phytophthora idaei]
MSRALGSRARAEQSVSLIFAPWSTIDPTTSAVEHETMDPDATSAVSECSGTGEVNELNAGGLESSVYGKTNELDEGGVVSSAHSETNGMK